ncbi:peptidoglycan editing factor PgeF [Clostridium sp. MT-14]|jgi:YfiH family protein|uniref:Purine nucleoside phosphorylase n=1 Tax=Clostridium aromativorans TaxID=2836848 RepID=A0ABS8N6K5_9CLOT|nr:MULTISPECIES: peptidoglycan editing factor PgeF [Clostridium]KAA8677023.1 peptidoglycan editing factor PgeF [Clostridium sp. HV4-5-A1G]MCC9294695.1 peptidoglycan editing factor PgeF [Clostridium aromativorans]
MEKLIIDPYEFITVDLKGAKAVFSTARSNLNFNKAEDEGKKNIENLKKWFKLENVGFLNQVHGCEIVIYNPDDKVKDGDGIITNRSCTAVGVFNADCVPVIIYDREKKVIAAVHSGWKGTLACVVSKAIEKLEKEYSSKPENLQVCVGPHIHSCCYEVGEEFKNKFKDDSFYRNKDHIFNGRNLDLKKCILYQLLEKGVNRQNINYLDICTACNREFKLYSYRKDRGTGRMFSFVYLDTLAEEG